MAQKDILTAEDDESKLKGEELVITEEDPSKKPPAAADHDDDDEEDERPGANAERDVDPEDPDDKEREAIRERRRLEKLERKERREKAIARDKLELEFLAKRNAELEKRFSEIERRQAQTDLSNVDAQLRAAINEVDMAEKVIAKAVAAGNGEDVAQAMRYRDQAKDKAQQLYAAKQQATQRPAAPEGMDERTMAYAKQFLGENKWYDPQGRDEDSAIVLAIDQTLVRDGYAPNTSEYWDELRKRAARRLPERFNVENPEKGERHARGGPSVGSGREHAPASSRKEVYISPERKQALMDAGVWDDPVLRMKYVKRYAEYDRNNRA